jgi:hypothetical protein
MEKSGKRWSVYDRYGNPIYLTQERWQHIVAENNHPEMIGYEEYLLTYPPKRPSSARTAQPTQVPVYSSVC